VSEEDKVLAAVELEDLAAQWESHAASSDGDYAAGVLECAERAREAAGAIRRLVKCELPGAGVRVTALDLKTGEVGERVINNDVCVITAGTCFISGISDYPKSGTQVITVKGRNGRVKS